MRAAQGENGRVLVIDDDSSLQRLVEVLLKREGYQVVQAENGADARRRFEEETPSAVVLDLGLPDVSGQELLASFKEQFPDVPVVVLTADGEVDQVVECMRLGAADYVKKPFEHSRLTQSVRRVQAGSRPAATKHGFDAILGRSEALQQTLFLLQRAARSDVTVLIEGESGTGKELAARALHAEGPRRAGPFVAVNCGAIPETLIENELFGHEKGSYTGAAGAQSGRFEQAEGGTLFLDEIGELRPDLQVRLLRVLQERKVWRIGAGRGRPINVRVVAATNRDLRQRIGLGKFRQDLYYRLAVFPVTLPSLRERESDIELLANEFVRRTARRHRRPIRGISPDTFDLLRKYSWPGNVRELENILERAFILEDGDTLTPNSLPAEISGAARRSDTSAPRPAPPHDLVQRAGAATDGANEIVPFDEQERRIILGALRHTNWNVQEAAHQLGLGRATVYRKIDRYRLRREQSHQQAAV